MRATGIATRRRSARGLVMLYHRVAGPRPDPMFLDITPANFDAQLTVMARWGRVLDLAEFERLRRIGMLPARALAITFDDGYADNLHAAAPALARHGLPATFFVASGCIASPRAFWWDDLERVAFTLRGLPPGVPVEGVAWTEDAGFTGGPGKWNILSETDPTPRHVLFRRLNDMLRVMPAARLARAMKVLRDWAGVAEGIPDSHRTMTPGELARLAGIPGMTIGAHSVTHPMLSRLSPDEQFAEMRQSKAAIEEMTGRPVRSIAYPYGTPDEVGVATHRAAEAAGFDFGMANELRAAWRWDSRWSVPRVLARDGSGDEFAARLDAWWAAGP